MTAQQQAEVGNLYALPFHLLLKAARTIQGVSQEKIARRIDVSVNTYRMWERGDYLPHVDVWRALCLALELDPMRALDTLPERITTGYDAHANVLRHPALDGAPSPRKRISSKH